MTRKLTPEQRAALDDLLSASYPAWLQDWTAYLLGLLVGAALSTGSIQVGLAVLGLPLAGLTRLLPVARPGIHALLVVVLAVTGILVGLLARS